jgi:HSP20 family protein
MLTRWNNGWNEFDDMFSALNQMRTYMDRLFEDAGGLRSWDGVRALPFSGETWPRANVIDAGSKLIVSAEVPGLCEKDIQLTLNQQVLSISGKREVNAPEGYSAHRQERPGVAFSRSFMLPCRVNADAADASVKDGILTVTLEKAPDAMPRQIAVRATA